MGGGSCFRIAMYMLAKRGSIFPMGLSRGSGAPSAVNIFATDKMSSATVPTLTDFLPRLALPSWIRVAKTQSSGTLSSMPSRNGSRCREAQYGVQVLAQTESTARARLLDRACRAVLSEARRSIFHSLATAGGAAARILPVDKEIQNGKQVDCQ